MNYSRCNSRRAFFAAILTTVIACGISIPASISAEQGRTKVARGALLVDVRTAEEYASGHVAGAKNIPHTEIENRLAEFGDDKAREIVLYCGSGRRAALAQESLEARGYKNVFNSGGYPSWKSGDQ